MTEEQNNGSTPAPYAHLCGHEDGAVLVCGCVLKFNQAGQHCVELYHCDSLRVPSTTPDYSWLRQQFELWVETRGPALDVDGLVHHILANWLMREDAQRERTMDVCRKVLDIDFSARDLEELNTRFAAVVDMARELVHPKEE